MLSATFSFFKRRGLFLVVALITISAIRTAFSLSGRQNELLLARQKLAQEQAEQKRLQEIQKSINSPVFIEKEARDKLGKAKPGETIVVLPGEDVLRSFAPIMPKNDEMSLEVLPVWRQWVEIFLPELNNALSRG
ncbi:MAG: septum formation initiator family protein [Candidatus Blackburnbacteria bacterium]|nr:septum formation initiator family protein [Candidatus Blackburnbacteria bacterium]